MILKTILNIFGFIGGKLIAIITNLIPTTQLGTELSTIITGLFTITQQALNFCYLLLGESLFIVLPIVTMLLFAKYVTIPIVIFLRSCFVNSNE